MDDPDIMHEYEILATMRDQAVLFIEMADKTTGAIDQVLALLTELSTRLGRKLMEEE